MKLLTLSCVLVLVGFMDSALAATVPSSELPELGRMQKKYGKTKTLTSEFVQRQINIALGTTKESSGRIYIKRPNMFRWETTQPEPSILVSNGKKAWYYTAPFREGEKGQVMAKKATDVQSRLAIDLLSGQGSPEKDFVIKKLEPGVLSLSPRKPAGDLEHIELHLEKSTDLVYKLNLFTKTGNRTELLLKNTALGPNLPDKMFSFVPPENTEEIK